jgi:hypothetical protein
MALSEALEELLKLIPDEADRSSSRALLEKYEPLRSGFLRQSDYDRFMNQTKQERVKEADELRKAQEYADKWEEWRKVNEPRHSQLLEEYEQLTRDKEDLLRQVREAAEKRLGDEDVDINAVMAQVEAKMATKGYVSKADVDKMVNEVATKLAHDEAAKIAAEKTDELYKQAFPELTRMNTTVSRLMMKHAKEFSGEDLDVDALFKHMNDNKVFDPSKAYDQMVGSKRTEIEIEKRAKERADKILAEERAKQPLPGTGAPPAPELGPLQLYRTKQTPQIPDDAEVGTNQLSNLAAAELRAEGKF